MKLDGLSFFDDFGLYSFMVITILEYDPKWLVIFVNIEP